MPEEDRYPYSFKSAIQHTRLENLFDSNMFSAYIPRELQVPRILDPRKTHRPPIGTARHPGQIPSTYINGLFSYIGFIKRTEDRAYRQYLPLLYKELLLFLRIMEDIVYHLNIAIPVEIYQEQKTGLENFFVAYRAHTGRADAWIHEILKHQKAYLEHVDMLMETLKARGRVFDFSDDPLYARILDTCRAILDMGELERPDETDLRCVANSCVKAARDREPKNLWSGDRHIRNILKALYTRPNLTKAFPQIYLYSNYEPGNHSQWFPGDVQDVP